MVGFYPDPPYRRLAYDIDGTRLLAFSGTTPIAAPSMATLNHETSSVANIFVTGQSLVFMLPDLTDIKSINWAAWSEWTMTIDASYSTTTTDGLDGTWTAMSVPRHGDLSLDKTRTYFPVVNVRATALKFACTYNLDEPTYTNVKLYGDLVSKSGKPILSIWHPTLDVEVGPAYFDWGDYARTSTEVRQFRVKNHGTTTATNVVVNTSGLRDSSIVSTLEVSTDGVSYAVQQNVGSIAPGLSSVFYIRRSTLSTTPLGMWWNRVVARAGGW